MKLYRNKKTNIYVFANSYKPVLGGIQTVASQFAEGCQEKGINIFVVTNLYPLHLKIYERISGVPVMRLPFVVPNGHLKNTLIFSFSFVVLFFLFLFRRPSYLYVHFPLSQSFYLTRLHRIFDFKMITCFHGHDVLRYDEGYSKKSIQYEAQDKLLRLSIKVTACSCYLARCVEKTFDCHNVEAVYNGVNLARFRNLMPYPIIQANSHYLFAWGRLEHIKGFDLLIKAFAKCRNVDGLKLLIAGEGTQREILQQMIDNLGLKDQVLLIGRLTPDDIVRYAQNSDINVIPSLRESFGIVALEAIAAKRPVISTNGGGLPEVMSEKYGLIVHADVDEISFAINRILSGKVNFDFSDVEEYLDDFTIPRMVDKYLSFIK